MNNRTIIMCTLLFIPCFTPTQPTLLPAQLPPQYPPFLHTPSPWADATLAQLSLKEKIGQLFIVAVTSNPAYLPNNAAIDTSQTHQYNMKQEHIESLIRAYHIGGVIFLQSNELSAQITLTNHYQALSKLPLLVVQDAEWGLTMRIKNTIRYPRALTMGAIQDDALLYELGKEIGLQCKTIGVHLNCAPVADVNNNPCNPVINDRSFGDDPQRVAVQSVAFMRGMQDAGILACAKHFPGHGDTAVDSHIALPRIDHSLARLHAVELVPFIHHIRQGVSSIMLAHLHVPALEPRINCPSSLSRAITTDMLRTTLGFTGLTITDGMGMQAVLDHYPPGIAEFEAIMAGNDCVLCPVDVPRAIALVEQAINDGTLSEDALNQRVLKVLRAKEYVGAHQNRSVSLQHAQKSLFTADALALRDAAYYAAITAVPATDDTQELSTFLDHDCGLIQIGTPVDNYLLTALHTHYPHLASFTISDTALPDDQLLTQLPQKNTLIISIHSANKYARQNFGLHPHQIHLVQQLHQSGKKIVLLLFANPYSRSLFPENVSCIYAYEDTPVTQRAVVDILLGKTKAGGKLPIALHVIAKNMCQNNYVTRGVI